MANTVTITVTIGQATAAELDQTTANAIGQETKEHVLRALGTKGYTASFTATTT